MRTDRVGFQGRTVRLAFLTILLVLNASPYAFAQNATKGRELAQALCAQCHMNEGQGEKRGPAGIPSFAAVANRPSQTDESVVAWLRSTPSVMPNHHLTQDEMYDLAAFIMTLRTPN